MSNLSVVLIHYPVLDKNGAIVTSSLTNIDIHDISRSSKTYGVKRFFVATPVRPLRLLAGRIMEHWESGFGSYYNENRKEALSLVRLEVDLDSTMLAIEREYGQLPRLIVSSAKQGEGRTSFEDLRQEMGSNEDPYLLILGTGWGLAPEVLRRGDILLEPIVGPTDYNHLSVRAAAAIMLDRLCAPR